jgi:hypothetical protein
MIKKFCYLSLAYLCLSSWTAFCQNKTRCDKLKLNENDKSAHDILVTSPEISLRSVLQLFAVLFEEQTKSTSNNNNPLSSWLKALSVHFEKAFSNKRNSHLVVTQNGENNLLISSLLFPVMAYLIKPGATFTNPLFEENPKLQNAARAVAVSGTDAIRFNNLHAFYNELKALDDDVVLAVIRFFLNQSLHGVACVSDDHLTEIAACRESDCSLLSLLLEYCQFIFPLTKK